MIRKSIWLALLMVLSMPIFSQAQNTDPVIYKDWTFLGESKTHIDVEYRVVKCNGVNQIHFFVFNESPDSREIRFEVEITNNVTAQKVLKEVVFTADKAAMHRAECASDVLLDKLKINVPENFNPSDLTLKITFKS